MKIRKTIFSMLMTLILVSVAHMATANSSSKTGANDYGHFAFSEGWTLFRAIFQPGALPKGGPVGGTSVVEPNAPNPEVCKGGYRWGRVTPRDPITKIYC